MKKLLLLLFPLMVLGSSCLSPLDKKEMSHSLVHHVFFWLEDAKNDEHRAQFEAAIMDLMRVENIRQFHFGIPASTEDRAVVDHSYTYSVMMVFDSQADQDTYQAHPIHVQFVEENQHLWEKVVVYDSVRF